MDGVVSEHMAEIPPKGEIPKDGIFAIIDTDEEKEKERQTLDV